MKLLNYLAVMLFAFSVNAQNVINQTYLDVPLNKIGEFVDLHEKVTNASIGEGRTIARSFVYRHWYEALRVSRPLQATCVCQRDGDE